MSVIICMFYIQIHIYKLYQLHAEMHSQIRFQSPHLYNCIQWIIVLKLQNLLFKELIFQFWKILCGFVYINVNVVTDDYRVSKPGNIYIYLQEYVDCILFTCTCADLEGGSGGSGPPPPPILTY